jgi:transposase-like protein
LEYRNAALVEAIRKANRILCHALADRSNELPAAAKMVSKLDADLREAQGARDRQYEYNVEQIAKQAVLEAELAERLQLVKRLTADNATLRDWVTGLQEGKRKLEAHISTLGAQADAYFAALQLSEKCAKRSEDALKKLHTLRPASEWHEDYGTVLWHHLPIQEPPHVGTPLDSDWDYYDEGYYTHWSPMPMNPELEWPGLPDARDAK